MVGYRIQAKGLQKWGISIVKRTIKHGDINTYTGPYLIERGCRYIAVGDSVDCLFYFSISLIFCIFRRFGLVFRVLSCWSEGWSTSVGIDWYQFEISFAHSHPHSRMGGSF